MVRELVFTFILGDELFVPLVDGEFGGVFVGLCFYGVFLVFFEVVEFFFVGFHEHVEGYRFFCVFVLVWEEVCAICCVDDSLRFEFDFLESSFEFLGSAHIYMLSVECDVIVHYEVIE